MLVTIIWVMTMGDDYVNYETTFELMGVKSELKD